MLDKNKLKAKMIEKNISTKELSEKIGINCATFYRKMAKGSFFVGEVAIIGAYLELSAKELHAIFFAK